MHQEINKVVNVRLSSTTLMCCYQHFRIKHFKELFSENISSKKETGFWKFIVFSFWVWLLILLQIWLIQKLFCHLTLINSWFHYLILVFLHHVNHILLYLSQLTFIKIVSHCTIIKKILLIWLNYWYWFIFQIL